MIFANGLFVAAGDLGTLLTSPDGTNWTARATPAFKNLWSVVYGQGTFVALGDNGVILQSDSTVPGALTGQYNQLQDQFSLMFTGELGRAYRIQTAAGLAGPWADLFVFTNTSPTMHFTDSNSVSATARRFYRGVTP